MIYRECVGVSHLSKSTCFTYLVSVRLIFFFFFLKKVFIYTTRSLKQGVFRSFVYQLNFDYLYRAVTMISAKLETVNQVLQQKQINLH